jgi:integrase
MRKAEVKITTLFELVIQKYIDNEQKSLPTVIHHISHLKAFFGEKMAERITDTSEYRKHRHGQGADHSTINRELSTLRLGYNLGIEKHVITKKPLIKLTDEKKNIRKGFFEDSQYQKQLEAIPQIKILGKPAPMYMRNVLRFGYESGWREGEILKLRWDINYEEDNDSLRIFDSKNAEGRLLPLLDDKGEPTELWKIIEEQKEGRVEGCPYIFHYQGRKPNKSTFLEHWWKACEISKIERFFHDFRRTAVRNLDRAGVRPKVAMEITGHRTFSVYERYNIINENDLKESHAKLAAFRQKRANGNTKIEPEKKPDDFFTSKFLGDQVVSEPKEEKKPFSLLKQAGFPAWVTKISSYFFRGNLVKKKGKVGKTKKRG